ncbi:hypothetical protein WDW86_06120 [Bdellovibrionota bacterium FG-2]
MTQIEVQVKLFGAFKSFADGQQLNLTIPAQSTVIDLKKILTEKLNAGDLVAKSAIADETRILGDYDLLQQSGSGKCIVSVLPPVCGG